jgi:hypothetical protein
MRHFGFAALIATLLALLAAATYYAYGIWNSLEAADLPLSVMLAMAGGVIFSLLVAIALMGLVFYSSRQGYDDRAAGGDDVA